MGCSQFKKIIKDHSNIHFLDDKFFFTAVKVYKTNRILQFTEAGFFHPSKFIKYCYFFDWEFYLRKIPSNANIKKVI